MDSHHSDAKECFKCEFYAHVADVAQGTVSLGAIYAFDRARCRGEVSRRPLSRPTWQGLGAATPSG